MYTMLPAPSSLSPQLEGANQRLGGEVGAAPRTVGGPESPRGLGSLWRLSAVRRLGGPGSRSVRLDGEQMFQSPSDQVAQIIVVIVRVLPDSLDPFNITVADV